MFRKLKDTIKAELRLDEMPEEVVVAVTTGIMVKVALMVAFEFIVRVVGLIEPVSDPPQEEKA